MARNGPYHMHFAEYTHLGSQGVNDEAGIGQSVQILWAKLDVRLPHQDLEVIQHGGLKLGLNLSEPAG